MDVEGPSMPDAYNRSLWSIACGKPKITQNTKLQPMLFFRSRSSWSYLFIMSGMMMFNKNKGNELISVLRPFRRFFFLHCFFLNWYHEINWNRVWYGVCTCKITCYRRNYLFWIKILYIYNLLLFFILTQYF